MFNEKQRKINLEGFQKIDNLSERAEKQMPFIEQRLQAVATIESPVRSKAIESRCKISGSEVRAVIRDLRLNGKPIGSSSKGYFWAHSEQELAQTWSHLHSRSNMLAEVARAISMTRQTMRSGKQKSLTKKRK